MALGALVGLGVARHQGGARLPALQLYTMTLDYNTALQHTTPYQTPDSDCTIRHDAPHQGARLGGVYPLKNEGFGHRMPPTTDDHFVVGDFIVVDAPRTELLFDEKMTLKVSLAALAALARAGGLVVWATKGALFGRGVEVVVAAAVVWGGGEQRAWGAARVRGASCCIWGSDRLGRTWQRGAERLRSRLFQRLCNGSVTAL